MTNRLVPDQTIDGVVFKELKSFPDDRGFFRELVRKTDDFFGDGFAQWSHSKMARNTVKAWHFHHLQTDWWYCGIGVLHVVLYDLREDSPTAERKLEFKLGDQEVDKDALSAVVKIPPGVAHGCKVLTDSAHLFYITNRTYDAQDEGRHPFNSDRINHSWGDERELIISERDRKLHIPPYKRAG